MAKIEYSALVNRIKGRVSHSILSNWKGMGIIKRHNSGIHQPRSEKQQAIRGMLSDLAGEYYALTTVQKELWRAFSSSLPKPMTPLNAYVKLNQIIQKYLPGTTKSTAPPPTPSTPRHVEGFTVAQDTGANFTITWTGPSTTGEYIVADYWPMPGFDNMVSPRFTFGLSADCADLCKSLVTTYPTGTVLKFRIRSIDSYGRVSPYSHMLVQTAL